MSVTIFEERTNISFSSDRVKIRMKIDVEIVKRKIKVKNRSRDSSRFVRYSFFRTGKRYRLIPAGSMARKMQEIALAAKREA